MNLNQALVSIEQEPIKRNLEETKLSVLWEKVKPFVVMLGTIFGKKVRVYIRAFTAAIDEIVANEEDEE